MVTSRRPMSVPYLLGPVVRRQTLPDSPPSAKDSHMTPADAYAELVRRSKELGVLNSCAAVLGWDQQTYMPAKGAGLRGEQMAFLAALSHQKLTDPKIGELLGKVESTDLVKEPSSDAAANVREWRRAYNRATKIPQS